MPTVLYTYPLAYNPFKAALVSFYAPGERVDVAFA